MRFIFPHFCSKALRVGWVVLVNQHKGNVIFYYAGEPSALAFPSFLCAGLAANPGIERQIKPSSWGCKSFSLFCQLRGRRRGKALGFAVFWAAWCCCSEMSHRPSASTTQQPLCAFGSSQQKFAGHNPFQSTAANSFCVQKNKWGSLCLLELLMMDAARWEHMEKSEYFLFPPPSCSDAPEPNKNFLLFPSIKLSKIMAVLDILSIL